MDELDYLPLSYLNQLEYCERRFWLMFVNGELAINAPMLEGIYRHERSHSGEAEQRGDLSTHRQVYVWSRRLKLVGLADCVEDDHGQLYPVEHKRGKMSRWINDHIQLCAQAMCMEEQMEQSINHGYIFYWRNRRREQVKFTPHLRARTEASVQHAFTLLAIDKLPPPTRKKAKCRDCSIEPICLPEEIRQLTKQDPRNPVIK